PNPAEPGHSGVGHELGQEAARRILPSRRADDGLESETPEPVRHVRHPSRHDPQARREALLAGNGKCLQAEEYQVEKWIADADDVDVHAQPPTGPGRARVTTYNAISSDRARPGFRVGTSV